MNHTYYKKFVEGGNYVDSKLEKMSDAYSQQFNSAIDSFSVVLNSDRADTIYHYNDITPYRALVDFNIKNKNSSLNKNLFKKEVRTRHSDGFNVGNIVEIENKISLETQTYLLTSNIETKEGFDLNIAEQCNYILKWQSSDLQIKEIPCVVYNSSMVSDGTDEDKYMRLPKGQIGILISANELTNTLKRDNRFFIHENVWRIDYIDRLQDGLLDITLVSDQIDITKDNVELGIADYVEVTEETDTPSTGYAVEIVGDSSIINNSSKTYTVKWLNNGVEITDTISSVNLSNDSLATATFTDNTITLTADRINKGTLTITVTSSVNDIVGTKDIQIKGLW